MARTDKDTTVIHSGGNGAGWLIVGVVLAVLVGGLFWYYNGGSNTNDLNIKVELPQGASN